MSSSPLCSARVRNVGLVVQLSLVLLLVLFLRQYRLILASSFNARFYLNILHGLTSEVNTPRRSSCVPFLHSTSVLSVGTRTDRDSFAHSRHVSNPLETFAWNSLKKSLRFTTGILRNQNLEAVCTTIVDLADLSTRVVSFGSMLKRAKSL